MRPKPILVLEWNFLCHNFTMKKYPILSVAWFLSLKCGSGWLRYRPKSISHFGVGYRTKSKIVVSVRCWRISVACIHFKCLSLACRLWAEIEAHKWRFLALLVDHILSDCWDVWSKATKELSAVLGTELKSRRKILEKWCIKISSKSTAGFLVAPRYLADSVHYHYTRYLNSSFFPITQASV